MAGTETPANQLPVHRDVQYEHSDLSSRAVLITGVSILIGTWVFVWLLYYFFVYLVHSREEAGPPPPARAVGKAPITPPEPRIQASPSTDLGEMRAREDSQLNSYGWVDRANGIVRIPIDRAIGLVAQRGVPATKPTLKVCPEKSATRQAGVGGIADPDTLCPPQAGTRETGFEGKVEPEPR